MPRYYVSHGEFSDSPLGVFIAVPAYSGLPAAFVHSLWNTRLALTTAGMVATLEILEEHCHVDDARNSLVRDFLETDCTDFLFLDADLGWNAEDVVRLLRVDKDIVAGTYPLKQTDSGFPIRPIPGELWADKDGCVEVEGVPTGFLRIRRAVLQTLYDQNAKFKNRKEPADRLSHSTIFERSCEGGERLSGDYEFCRKARAAGYKIHVMPDLYFQHVGQHSWSGSLGDYWRKEHGISEKLFYAAFDNIRNGTETEEDVINICKFWGNVPWAAGQGLVSVWIDLAREAEGNALECGSGITSLVASAANPELQIYSIDHDLEWGMHTKAYSNMLGIENLHVIQAQIKDGWYDLPDSIPDSYSLALVDGPPRDLADRFLISGADIDIDGPILWDDIDQGVMRSQLDTFAESRGANVNIFNHPTKNFAVVS